MELQRQVIIEKEGNGEKSATTEVESFKTEAANISDAHTAFFSDTPKLATLQEDEQQVQLRRQIVSLGKQPKAQQIRRKKDMVRELNFAVHIFSCNRAVRCSGTLLYCGRCHLFFTECNL